MCVTCTRSLGARIGCRSITRFLAPVREGGGHNDFACGQYFFFVLKLGSIDFRLQTAIR